MWIAPYHFVPHDSSLSSVLHVSQAPHERSLQNENVRRVYFGDNFRIFLINYRNMR